MGEKRDYMRVIIQLKTSPSGQRNVLTVSLHISTLAIDMSRTDRRMDRQIKHLKAYQRVGDFIRNIATAEKCQKLLFLRKRNGWTDRSSYRDTFLTGASKN